MNIRALAGDYEASEGARLMSVGELTDYIVSGHSELLFRKTRGPWSEFAAPR